MDWKTSRSGDPALINKIVEEYMSQGKFDQLRRQLLTQVDTRPSYQNVKQRMESTVRSFLAKQQWRPDLNKNQLRDSLKKHILVAHFLRPGVGRIVDQLASPSSMTDLRPDLESITKDILGIKDEPKAMETLPDDVDSENSREDKMVIITEEDEVKPKLDIKVEEAEDRSRPYEKLVDAMEDLKIPVEEKERYEEIAPVKSEKLSEEPMLVDEVTGDVPQESALASDEESDHSIINQMSPISAGTPSPPPSPTPLLNPSLAPIKRASEFIGKIPKLKKNTEIKDESKKEDTTNSKSRNEEKDDKKEKRRDKKSTSDRSRDKDRRHDEKGGDRHKDRDRDRERRDRDRDRSKTSSDKDRNRRKDGERDKSRDERSNREKVRHRENAESKDRDRRRDKDREKNKGSHSSRDRDRYRDKYKPSQRSKDRSRDRSKSRREESTDSKREKKSNENHRKLETDNTEKRDDNDQIKQVVGENGESDERACEKIENEAGRAIADDTETENDYPTLSETSKMEVEESSNQEKEVEMSEDQSSNESAKTADETSHGSRDSETTKEKPIDGQTQKEFKLSTMMTRSKGRAKLAETTSAGTRSKSKKSVRR